MASGHRSSHTPRDSPGFRFPHELRLPGGPETDVRLGIEEQLIPGKPQADPGDERRFIEADPGRERVVPGPGAADRRRLLGEGAIRHPALLPGPAPAGDPPFDAVESRDEGHRFALAVALERD